MDNLRLTLVQSDIIWKNKSNNLRNFQQLLETVKGFTDIVVLPEMFSTGFSMDSFDLAETNEEETVNTLKRWSVDYEFAIAGSFLAKDEQHNLYNRGFFITPEGESFFYDKRHLFRPGNEKKPFKNGEKQLIVSYKGWNINLIICYDLRFPVWSRNVNNSYDLMICPANWPESRNSVWEILLKARAIENMSYVCGVNRVGKDGNGLSHKGSSLLLCPKGEILLECPANETILKTYTINKNSLEELRKKFPVWKDADKFIICD